VRYVVGNRTILGAELIDINAMVFGMPRALFPAIGLSVFGGTPTTVGLLYAAPGAGAVLGAVSSGWLQSVERQGRAVILAVVAWGASIALFGLVPWLWLALVLLAVAGASDVVSAVFRNTILQVSTPDRLRGRVSSVHIAVVTGGPRLGDIEAGTVAAIAGPQVSVVSGGLACMAGAGVIARLFPELRGWNRSEHLARPDHQPPGRAANHPG
jgi:MFS family permease